MTNLDVSKLGNNPNEPRQIRARTGMTQDPLPAGKKLEEKPFPKIQPAEHEKGIHSTSELPKEAIQAHKEELQHMQAKDAKHAGKPNNMNRGEPAQSQANVITRREPRS